jgi:predicted transcriptional regulator of viral defense system
MELINLSRTFGSLPVSHASLAACLSGHRNINDKIHRWILDGYLVALRRGLYVFSKELTGSSVNRFLVANQLYGPSYISNDSALSHYQAIPERVRTVTSVTVKASKRFSTPEGDLEYIHLTADYYRKHFLPLQTDGRFFVMIASPEKALFDKLITTSNLTLRSTKEAAAFTLDDLRIDEDFLKELRIDIMLELASSAPKKSSLKHLIKFIGSL